MRLKRTIRSAVTLLVFTANMFSAGFCNEWSWMLRNTYSTEFTVFGLDFELDRMTGTLNINFLVLGLGFWLCLTVRKPSPILTDALHELVANLKEQETKQ